MKTRTTRPKKWSQPYKTVTRNHRPKVSAIVAALSLMVKKLWIRRPSFFNNNKGSRIFSSKIHQELKKLIQWRDTGITSPAFKMSYPPTKDSSLCRKMMKACTKVMSPTHPARTRALTHNKWRSSRVPQKFSADWTTNWQEGS